MPQKKCFRSSHDQQLFRSCVWLATTCLLAGCDLGREAPSIDLSGAKYVGRAACVNCHSEQAQLHVGSQHQQAMQVATETTVLADFNDATFAHHGVTSRMFRDGDKYMVRTEGPSGELNDFEVKYVFGVTPLQQYMVEFPSSTATMAEGEISRVQVLRLSWDTERMSWFYLPPPDVADKLAPDDDLHWTGIAQRWNNMCADCHSTDYQKNFAAPQPDAFPAPSPANDIPGAYHSTFVEINVSCEACHGPGSVHVDLASQWFPGWNRQRGYGLANLKASAENEIQACAPCHSRRRLEHGGFRAGDNYYDYFSNTLLTEPTYYPDGQVLDEDYVHGSFIQSKMYHRGIRCSDCHDPHTARLKREGNEVCTSCHQHPQAKYDSVAHHRHLPGSAGAQCVNCHMPTTTYMEVDARRDHSLRIPRPDLSLQIDTPNACTGCHLKLDNIAEEKRPGIKLYQDWLAAARAGDEQVKAELKRADAWCDAACDEWYGPTRRRDEHFGLALAAGQRGEATAREQLTALLSRRGAEAPAIARATGLQILSRIDPRQGAVEASRAIDDEHPLVRSTAAQALSGHPQATLAVSQLEQALSDPVRIVRIEAARTLLEFPRELMSSTAGAAWRAALDELTQGIEQHNDRAGAHVELGLIAARQGRRQQAIMHYETGIAVEPQATGA
ncbi:MAG: cytochrome c3 family protein, partial [Aureliella sp.]